jgi:hypothetical protein
LAKAQLVVVSVLVVVPLIMTAPLPSSYNGCFMHLTWSSIRRVLSRCPSSLNPIELPTPMHVATACSSDGTECHYLEVMPQCEQEMGNFSKRIEPVMRVYTYLSLKA